MFKGDIISFFEHIQEREKTEDIGQVFRFHNVEGPKALGGVVTSKYPDEKVPEDEEPVKPKKKYKRRAKQKDPAQQEMEAVMLMMVCTILALSSYIEHN